jgi:hypothetical protein
MPLDIEPSACPVHATLGSPPSGPEEDQRGASGYGRPGEGASCRYAGRRISRSAGAVRTPMTMDEFLAHFPEVPSDLRCLGEYVAAFGLPLRVARKPTPCMRDTGDHQRHRRLRHSPPHAYGTPRRALCSVEPKRPGPSKRSKGGFRAHDGG